MKLNRLIVVLLIAIAIVPAVAGMAYLSIQTAEHERRQFELHVESMSLLAKQHIITSIDGARDATQLIASRTQLRISLQAWNQSKDTHHQSKIKRIISDATLGMDSIQNIAIYDAGKQLVAATNASLQASEALFYSHDVLVDLVRIDEQTLLVTKRALALDGHQVGELVVLHNPDFIGPLSLDHGGLGTTGEWLFARRDDKGDAVFMLPLKHDADAAFKRTVNKKQTEVPIIQALLGYESLMHDAPDYRDVPVMAFTRYLPNLAWGIVAKVDEAEVNDLLQHNTRVTLLISICATSFALVIGAFLIVYITEPVIALNKDMKKAADGEYKRPTRRAAWKEVNELSERLSKVIVGQQGFNERLQTEVKQRTAALADENSRLSELAMLDAVTKVANRFAFESEFKNALELALDKGVQLAVAMVDIDRFKSINDLYGHNAGDQVLTRVAETLQLGLRNSDVLARFGGDEFCILLPNVERSAAVILLDRLRVSIAELEFEADGQSFHTTCSMGIACLDPTFDPETLLDKADVALYEAKKSGRNCVMTYLKQGSLS